MLQSAHFLVEQGVLPASEREANHEMDRRYGSGEASTLEYVRFYLGYYRPYDMERLLGWRRFSWKKRFDPDAAGRARADPQPARPSRRPHHRHQPLPGRADRLCIRHRARHGYRAGDRERPLYR